MTTTNSTPIEISCNNIFQNDKLNREPEIENLSSLLSNLKLPTVMSIDSEWGTGKTTFIKFWQCYLKDEYKTLLFNAWETDYAEDPLLAFTGELISSISSNENQFLNELKGLATNIVRSSLFKLTSHLTAGTIDLENAIKPNLIDGYLSQKEAIKDFKTILKQFISSECGDKPLIVFIDELDRCRPDYAIELLERVKHIFSTSNVIFVLALDTKQLSHSIKAVYGNDFDAENYLRRFIDLKYELNRPNHDDFVNKLFFDLNLESHFTADKARIVKDTFLKLAVHHKISLRKIQQYLNELNLIFLTGYHSDGLNLAFITFLYFAKNENNSMFMNYFLENSTEEEMIEYLYSISIDSPLTGKRIRATIEGCLIGHKYSLDNRKTSGVYSGYNNLLRENESTPHNNKNQDEINYANNVVRVVQSIHENLNYDSMKLNEIYNRLSLGDKFSFPALE